MRDYGAPRSKMRELRAPDVIAHWRMKEDTGTSISDLGPEGTGLTSASAANIVVGPFIGDDVANYGRDVAANNAIGASTSAQRATMRDNDWTIELWMRPTSTASTGTLLTLGVAGNYIVVVQVIPGAALRVQLGGTTDTMTGLWAAGDDVHVGIRRTITGATCMLEVFVNGLRVYMATAVALSTSSTTGGWTLGSSASSTVRFPGVIWEVRIAALAMPDEAIREGASRGLRDWSITRAIDSGEATVHRRALIHDGDGTFVDVTRLYSINWLRGWEESETVDDDGASGTLELRRRSEWHSMSPWMTESRANIANPLGQTLNVRRRIKLEEAIVPAGVDRAEVGELHWGLVFDGWCRNVGGVDGDTVKLALMDGAYPLQWAWAQPNRGTSPHTDFVYAAAATPIEDVIRQILADHRPTAISGVVEGYGAGAAVELFVPASPGYVVDNSPGGFTTPSSKSVMQTLLDLVDTTIAWHLRYRWDDTRQQFRLTLLDPGRGKTWTTGAPVLEQRNIRRWRRLEIDDADIRNDFEIEHNASGVTDNLGVAGRAIYRVEHLASVGRFRRAYARLALVATTQLKTMGEVMNLGAMMVSDLAYPLADMEIELPARRDIEIGDVVRIRPDDVRLDINMDVAVVGIAHTRRGRDITTTLTCRQAAPVGRRRRWFDR
ncbi:MAG TPA: LamG-like jellyroll fold domain-containing protein, partial [Myxococcota bacterium]